MNNESKDISEMSSINDLISSIEGKVNPQSRYYGKLIKWKSGNEWFYGIGLSDNDIFDTRNLDIMERDEIDQTEETDKKIYGPFPFPIFVVKPSLSSISPSDIIDRLKYVLLYIQSKSSDNKLNRETWNGLYNKEKWNDEHLSRLITCKTVISRKGLVGSKKKFSKGDTKKCKEINLLIKENNPDSYLTFFNKEIPIYLASGRFWFFLIIVILVIILVVVSSGGETKWYFLIAPLILFVFLISKLPEYEWSGFQNKQLWNWLELLFVPILLAIGGFYLQQQAEERQEQSDKTNAQNQMLIEYFKNIKDIIQKSDSSQEKLSENDKKLIESFTKIVLPEINGNHKRQVVNFLYRLGLIKGSIQGSDQKNQDNPNRLNLSEADFSNAQLNNLNLQDLYLQDVNLKKVNFSKTNLKAADLRGSTIEEVEIDLVNLKNATVVTDRANFTNTKEREKWEQIQRIQSSAPDSEPELEHSDSNGELKSSSLAESISDPSKDETEIRRCKYKTFGNKTTTNLEKSDINNSLSSFLQPLTASKNLANFNLEGLDLSGVNFTESILTGTSFKNSILAWVNFKQATLDKKTIWEGAYLKGTQFDDSAVDKLDDKTRFIYYLLNKTEEYMEELSKEKNKNLENANLSYIEMTHNSGQDQKLEIPEINLKKSKLMCSKFSKLNMSKSNLSDADLTYAKLTDIDLPGSNLNGAIMKKTIMKRVDLRDTNLFFADLTEAEISGKLEKANLNSAIIKGADLSQVKDLDKASFWNTTYDKETKFPKDFKPENHKGLEKLADR